jgi:hypothetical protein
MSVAKAVNLDTYCVRCDSEIGHAPETSKGPDWCWVCNDWALRLSPRIRALIEEVKQ